MADLPTADTVRNALQANVHNVELESSDHAEGVRASVHPAQAGAFFETLRTEGFEFDASRVGGHIVAHIEAEEENKGLGTLFSG